LKTSKRLSVAAIIACLALLGALVVGSTADAKKKKKQSSTVTATRTAPALAPQHAMGSPRTLVPIPLTIGKKAKGKIVDSGSPELTYTITGAAGELSGLEMRLTAPNGRTIGIYNPADDDDTVVGPLTITANSPIDVCNVIAADPPPPPPCLDPEETLLAPYAGTVGDAFLASFNGIGAKGMWTLKLINHSITQPATLISAKLTVPTASKFKG
jgi:hypothetical protein